MSLTLTDITLSYADGDDRLIALDNVSMSVPDGNITAVLGPSGSGKSSLLAVAATLTTPDAGSVRIGDIDATGISSADAERLRRERIGIVFQEPQLLPSLTALEQLELMTHLLGKPARSGQDRARELLDAVGLSAQAHKRPGQLSGGQRQRINIARALMNEPELLLVDEPTSALDHARGVDIVELISNLTRETGAATVLVTHDEATLTGVDGRSPVDGLVRMADGRVLGALAIATPNT